MKPTISDLRYYESIRAHIPLAVAMLCVDCDTVFEPSRGVAHCPACASPHALALAPILDRREK